MDTPWSGDACSLVDAFRSGERSPVEEVDACLTAIDRTAGTLNAFSYVDADGARRAAVQADVSLPLGGVPIGIKELDAVAGWPLTEASLVFKDRIADHNSVLVDRLRAAGAVLVGLTTASEYGGVNYTRTKLNGATRNPWDNARTPGGSSGGSAAAVAGGVLTLGSAGDGGGSIRIPAAFTGLPGLKCTYGRIPHSPGTPLGSMTAVMGCLSRSVRDIARWLDVSNGLHPTDPFSLPRVDGYEAGLAGRDLAGLRAAVVMDFGGAVVNPAVVEVVSAAAADAIRAAGLKQVEVPVALPSMGVAWALSGTATILTELGDLWPECAGELTPDIRFALEFASATYNLASRAELEGRRAELNTAMASVFDQTDLVLTASCPDVAFAAEGPMPTEVAGRPVDIGNNGALTIPANIYGNPSVSVPVGLVDGLPVGLQIMAAHHREDVLLDLALLLERERPWPVTAPV